MSFFANHIRWFAVSLCVTLVSISGTAYGSLITNPPIPIQYQVTINPIIVSNTDSSNTAEYFGNAAQQTEILDLVNTVWAQAGIQVNWQATETWNDDFVNIGTPGFNNPRPTSDLNTIVSTASSQGRLDSDPNVINMFFVEIAAGFSDTGENTANGLAFVDGNGITQHVGDNLVGFLAGREVIASVVAHEIGHNLGLSHLVETENLMQAGGSPDQGERLNASQIATAQASAFSVSVPEPGSVVVVAACLCAGVLRRRRTAI